MYSTKEQKKGITRLSSILAERMQKQDGVRSRQDCLSRKMLQNGQLTRNGEKKVKFLFPCLCLFVCVFVCVCVCVCVCAHSCVCFFITLSAHAREGYSSHTLSVSLSVCHFLILEKAPFSGLKLTSVHSR